MKLSTLILSSSSSLLHRRGISNNKRWFSSTINYENYLSKRSKLRQPSAIRALQPLLSIPGMISLGGGMPNQETFPFRKITCEMLDGTIIDVCDEETIDESFQYSPTQGIPRLVKQLEILQQKEHNNNSENSRLCITTGSQDALGKAFDMLLDEDSSLIIEDPTYSGSLAYLKPMNCFLKGVKTDKHGMMPDELEHVLENWEHENIGKPKPKCIYIIPTGSNPTGATMPISRKQKIYEIAVKHDLLILEDDPYYYMQFNEDEDDGQNNTRVQSFYSIDDNAENGGRVIRFDSFSKLISSGLRIGFVTGPTELIERIELHSQSTTLHTSGISQSIVASYFDYLKSWSTNGDGNDNMNEDDKMYQGFLKHVGKICAFYKHRRDVFLKSADMHLTGLCEWNNPSAGMFVWIKVNNCNDTLKLVKEKALDAKVIFVPGESFFSNGDVEPSNYVRAAYSTAGLDDMDEALKRFAAICKTIPELSIEEESTENVETTMPLTIESDQSMETNETEINTTERITGQVSKFIASKGYGFINATDGRNIFVHVRSLKTKESAITRFLHDGEYVSFTVSEEGHRDDGSVHRCPWKAENVKGVFGGSLACEYFNLSNQRKLLEKAEQDEQYHQKRLSKSRLKE